jgi:hypothetical protein
MYIHTLLQNAWLIDNNGAQITDIIYKQIVHLTGNALLLAVQDSSHASSTFCRLVRANLKCKQIDAGF